MISIKRLLNADPEAAPSMLRVAELLVRGIGEHAIRCDPDQYLIFQTAMERKAAALAQCAAEPEALTQAENAIRALEEYNRRTAQQLRVRSAELQSMVKMLTSTIGEISTTGEENVSRLHRIEGMVSSVTQIEDVRTVKAQLSVCLGEIRKEAERQKLEASGVIERLKQNLAQAQRGSFNDAVTGLPMRAQAVELISNTCEAKQPAFALVMAVERLQAVNTAFGPEAGDQLLQYFSGCIRSGLPPEDHLFRWTGVSLLAVVVRQIKKIDTLRAEIGRLMGQKFEFAVHTATRNVRLPVTARWALFPMTEPSQVLIPKLDGFAAMQPARG